MNYLSFSDIKKGEWKERTYTDEFRYCDFCNRKFLSLSELTDHLPSCTKRKEALYPEIKRKDYQTSITNF